MSERVLAALKVAPSTQKCAKGSCGDSSGRRLDESSDGGLTDVTSTRSSTRRGDQHGARDVGYCPRRKEVCGAHASGKAPDVLEHNSVGQCGGTPGRVQHETRRRMVLDRRRSATAYTSIDTRLPCGGFSKYLYWPSTRPSQRSQGSDTERRASRSRCRRVQWAVLDAGSATLDRPIQGGQKGLLRDGHPGGGRRPIIVTGTERDARRLEVAKQLGADDVIDVDREDPLARIREITEGRGVDVAIDCTGAGLPTTLLGIEATKRRGATMVLQAEGNAQFANFPIGKITRKGMTLKSARGHSYRAVELALGHLASGRFPLELMTTHRFGLSEVDYAIKSVGGEGAPGAIHVSVMPWK